MMTFNFHRDDDDEVALSFNPTSAYLSRPNIKSSATAVTGKTMIIQLLFPRPPPSSSSSWFYLDEGSFQFYFNFRYVAVYANDCFLCFATANETRLGEILLLLRKLIKTFGRVWGSFSSWQNFESTLAKQYTRCRTKFHCWKLPNNLSIWSHWSHWPTVQRLEGFFSILLLLLEVCNRSYTKVSEILHRPDCFTLYYYVGTNNINIYLNWYFPGSFLLFYAKLKFRKVHWWLILKTGLWLYQPFHFSL